jgi:gliding motility-associated-like protein
MKVFNLLCGVILYFFVEMLAFSQSNATITNITTVPASCTPGPCLLCPGNTIQMSLTGTNLPNGNNVLWYYGSNPTFDPYVGGAGVNLIGSSIISTTPSVPPITPCATCPELVYLQVDGCPGATFGDQLRGEFAVVSSGSGFNLSDLRFAFDPTLVGGGVNANIGFGTCSWQAPTQAMVNTVRGLCPCTNVIGVVPGQVIPPNSYLVLYTNGTGNNASGQNFAGLCGKASQIYVAQNSCARSNISFLNFDSGPVGQTRTQTLSLASCGCSQPVTYNLLGSPPPLLGDRVVINGGVVTQSSPGCPSAPNPPQLPLSPVNNPSTTSTTTLTINPGMCNNGPFYIKPAINPWPDPSCPRPTPPVVPSFNVICPTATASHTGPVCTGGPLNLFATGGGTYAWTGPGGFTSTAQNPVVNPAVAGTYTVVVSSGPGCTATASTTVTILPAPVVTATANTPVCEGAALNLNVTPAGTGYSWTGPNSFTSNIQNPTINPVTPAAAGTYNVTVTHANGCTSSSNVTVVVNPNPTFTPVPTTVCSNAGGLNLTTTLTPAPTGGSWSGTGVTGTTFNPTGLSGTINVTFTPAPPCGSPIVVPINVTPVPTLTVTNTGPVCTGSPVSLNVTPTGNGVVWGGPGGFSSTLPNPTINPAVAGTYNVTVTINPGGCLATGNTVVALTPPLSATLNPANACIGGATINLTTLLGPGAPPGTWSGTGVTGTTFTPPAVPGPVVITYTPTGPCAVPTTTTITVLAPVTTTITPATLCSNAGNLNLTTLLSPNIPGTWSGTGVTGTNFNPTGLNGPITVTFTPTGPCGTPATGVITVNPAVTVVLTPAVACANGAPINLTTLLSPNIPGTWSGTGVSGTTFTPGTNVGPNTITFTPASTCSSPATTVITVNPTPTATISGTANVCGGSSVNGPITISFTGTGPWTFTVLGNGSPVGTFTSSSNPYILNVSPLVNTTYTLQSVTGAGGCPGTVSGTSNVTVITPPIATIQGSGNFCAGASGIASLLISLGGSGPYTIVYAANGVSQPPINVPAGQTSHTVNVNVPSVTTTYTLVSITNGTCPGLVNGSAVINIIPVGTPVLSPATVCTGSGLFNLVPLQDPSFSSGTWSGQGVSGTTFNPTGLSGPIVLTFTPAGGCSLPANTTITVSAPPAVVISGGGSVCAGQDVTLTFTFTGPGPYTIRYTNGSITKTQTSITSNPFTTTETVNFSGTYTVTLVSNPACTGTSSGTATVTVTPPVTPVLGTLTVCENQGLINLNPLRDPRFLTGTWSGPGVSGTNFNPTGRNGNVVLTFTPTAPCTNPGTATIRVNPSPSGVLSGTAAICAGGTTNLQVAITGGNGPFSLTYSATGSGTTTVNNINSTLYTFPVNPTATTTYTLTAISEGTCVGTVSGAATVTVSQPVTFSNLSRTCSGSNYEVIFDIAGGTPPYTVTGFAGTITGSRFTSGLIPSNTPITFTIADSGPCPDVTLNVNLNCSCITNAGTLGQGSNACTTGSLEAQLGGSSVLDPNDVEIFVLSSSATPSAGTILATNSLPNFPWVPTYSTGTTYYIIRLVYSAVTPGNPTPINWTDPCFASSNAVPVLFFPDPSLTISRDTSICLGTDANILLNLNGTPPFVVGYELGGTAQTSLVVASSPFSFTVRPTNTGVSNYNFTQVTDFNGCIGTVNLPVSVTVLDAPSIVLSGNQAVCNGDSATLIINTNGTAPIVFSLTENNVVIRNITMTSTGTQTIRVGPLGTANYGLSSVTSNDLCPILPSGTPAVTVNPKPSGSITGGGIVCVGTDAVLNYSLLGQPPFTLRLNADNPVRVLTYPNLTNSTGSLQIPITVDTRITGIQITDAGNCSDTLPGDLSYVIRDAPRAANVQRNCASNQLTYTVTFDISGGDASTYTIDGGAGVILGNGFSSTSIPSGSNYEFILRDANGCGNDTIRGRFVCGCIIDAGNMTFNAQNICLPGSVPASVYQGGRILNPGDTLMFMLTSLPDGRGTIFGYFSTPNVTIQTGMVTNRTYYLTAVAGKPLNGGVNLLDPCLDYSNSTPVIFYDRPSAVLSGGGAVCPGGNVPITVTLTGGLTPFSFDLTGSSPQTVVNHSSRTYTLTLTPSVAGSLGLSNLVDSSGCLGSNNGSASWNILPPRTFTLIRTLCSGSSLTVGTEVFNELRPTGTTTLLGAAQGGCDSVVTVNLSFRTVVTGLLETELCDGGFTIISGTRFDASNPVGTISFPGAAQGGCDSNLLVRVRFRPKARGTLPVSLCIGGSFNLGGKTFDASNPGDSVLLLGRGFRGCDSTVIVRLTFQTEVINNISTTLCPNGFITVRGTRYDATNPRGIERFVRGSFQGCDSVVNINLQFRPSAVFSLNRQLCTGQTLTVGSTQFSELNPTGTITLPNAAFGGCDSTITVSLTFGPAVVNNINRVFCEGEQLVVNGRIYDQRNPSGQERIPNGSFTGCDSIINVTLTFQANVVVRLVGTNGLCLGDSASLEFVFTRPGNYTITFNDGANNRYSFVTTDSLSTRKIEVSSQWQDSVRIISVTGPPCPVKIGPAIFVNVSALEDSLRSTLRNGFNIGCNGGRDGRVEVVSYNGRQPYQYRWSDNPSTAAIRTNLSAGTYFVTITDGLGCVNESTAVLTEPSPLNSNIRTLQPGCRANGKGSIFVENINGGVQPYRVTLNGSNVSPSGTNLYESSNLDPGNYSVVIEDLNGCISDSTVDLSKNNLPTISIEGPTLVEFGDSVQLRVVLNFRADSILWTPKDYLSCVNCLDPTSKPLKSITYNVIARDSSGCEVDGSIFLRVFRTKGVYVPDAFSPNGDGNNDILLIYPGPGAKKIKSFQIYDRWGEKVFAVKDKAFFDFSGGWKGDFRGAAVNADVFVYWAEVEMEDGTIELLNGDVTVVR